VSGSGETAALPPPGRALRARQLLAVVRLELPRVLFGRRAVPMYVLAVLPVLVLALKVWIERRMGVAPQSPGYALSLYGDIYQGFILRLMIFFGCLSVFSNLIRGEILDRSLHYWFLVPVRREIVLVGKYLSGVAATVLLFGGSTLGSFLLSYLVGARRGALDELLTPPVPAHLTAYLGATVLACIGYGAVFMALGLLLRNPIVSGVSVFGWEWLNFLLPPLLKKISVVYWLQSICPVPVSEGPYAIVAVPAPAWAAVLCLLGLTAALLAVAGFRIRRLQIAYTTE